MLKSVFKPCKKPNSKIMKDHSLWWGIVFENYFRSGLSAIANKNYIAKIEYPQKLLHLDVARLGEDGKMSSFQQGDSAILRVDSSKEFQLDLSIIPESIFHLKPSQEIIIMKSIEFVTNCNLAIFSVIIQDVTKHLREKDDFLTSFDKAKIRMQKMDEKIKLVKKLPPDIFT